MLQLTLHHEGLNKDNFTSTQPQEKTTPFTDGLCCTEVGDISLAIDSKLSGLDARIALVKVIHKEFQQLSKRLTFGQEQLAALAKENKSLRHPVTSLATQLATIAKENKGTRETMLDLRSRSMRIWDPRSKRVTTNQKSYYRNL